MIMRNPETAGKSAVTMECLPLRRQDSQEATLLCLEEAEGADVVEEEEAVEVVAKSSRGMRLDVSYDWIMLLYDLTYYAWLMSLYVVA
jgi:hypothetical protein